MVSDDDYRRNSGTEQRTRWDNMASCGLSLQDEQFTSGGEEKLSRGNLRTQNQQENAH